MDFSSLHHRITFQKPTGTDKNTMGESVPIYTDDITVWANVSPMTGREYEESQKIRAETTYKINTRYFPNIITDMKVIFREKIFDIVSVLNIDEKNVMLQLICVEVDTNGKE